MNFGMNDYFYVIDYSIFGELFFFHSERSEKLKF